MSDIKLPVTKDKQFPDLDIWNIHDRMGGLVCEATSEDYADAIVAALNGVPICQDALHAFEQQRFGDVRVLLRRALRPTESDHARE